MSSRRAKVTVTSLLCSGSLGQLFLHMNSSFEHQLTHTVYFTLVCVSVLVWQPKENNKVVAKVLQQKVGQANQQNNSKTLIRGNYARQKAESSGIVAPRAQRGHYPWGTRPYLPARISFTLSVLAFLRHKMQRQGRSGRKTRSNDSDPPSFPARAWSARALGRRASMQIQLLFTCTFCYVFLF